MSDKEQPRPLGRRLKVFWILNIVVIVALLLSYLGVRISPAKFWPLAFFSMAYPYILLLNVVFIFFWVVVKRKRRSLYSLIAILLGLHSLGNFIQIRPFGGPSAPEGVNSIKVMSYNVRLFDLYNWTKNKQTRDKIFSLLNKETPDVLCLQEFFNADDNKYFNTKDTLLNSFDWRHCHDDYTQRTKRGHKFGIATFSKWPIVKKGVLRLSDHDNNICIWNDIVVREDTFRIYNAHLASIRFGNEDYRFIQDLESGGEEQELALGGKRILTRLKNAFKKRGAQAERIAEHMLTSPYPIVYCGDLNDTPNSYSYAQLDHILEDAFKVSGSGIGNTYIGDFPSFRIDHIMHSSTLRSWDFRTLPEEYSDHHAVVCHMAKQ